MFIIIFCYENVFMFRWSGAWTFFVVALGFSVIVRKPFGMFISSTCRFHVFTLRSLIHFELFLGTLWGLYLLLPFSKWLTVVPALLMKKLIFAPVMWDATFSIYYFSVCTCVYFWALYSIPLVCLTIYYAPAPEGVNDGGFIKCLNVW